MTQRTNMTVEETCESCEYQHGTAHYHAIFSGTEARLSKSFSCPRCGNSVEADFEQLPPDVMLRFICRDGLWGLYLDAVTGSLPVAVKTIAQTFAFSRSDALKLAKRLPSTEPVMKGMRESAEELMEHLANNGVEAHLAAEK